MHSPRGLVLRELADCLEERQRLDVAHGAADLAEHEIDFVFADGDEVLDLVSDVGDHLNGFAEIVAAPFLIQHVLIDAARRDAVGLARRDAGEALVVAQIEIGLRAVIGDEHFAMLEGRHRAGIHVEIRVELAQPHAVSPSLQQGPQRSTGQSLAKRRHHPAGDENESSHVRFSPCSVRFTLPGCASLLTGGQR